ncbi:hypothetical protein [Pseudooceanicola sp. LIPI14-2-Ac024]|uniref:hypothetical protein n=1 Tax=Pseudooceanicola sp. LIPI14-2-Ac024 TaxID=3344875 RepID=UPI0035CF3711
MTVLKSKLDIGSDPVGAVAAVASPLPAPVEPRAGGDIVQGGRSIYYSAFAATGAGLSLWVPIFLQCLAVSWLVTELHRNLVPRSWPVSALATLVLLACFSSLALFANLIMPDIWASAAIIALALLWSPSVTLSNGAKWLIAGILCFSALSHSSHIALIAAMCLTYAAVRLSGRAGLRGRQALALPMIAVLAGVLGQVAFGLAVHGIYGTRILERPHITAHLVDLGPGAEHARESCPESGYALCAYRDKLPVDWIAFMFSRSDDTAIFAVADTETQKELAEEQLRFAIDTVKAYPAATIAGLSLDGIRQLWTLSVTDVPLNRATTGNFLNRNFTPAVAETIRTTQVYRNPGMAGTMTRVIEITSALSLVFLAIWAIAAIRGDGAVLPPGTGTVVATILGGVILNALICGILASPYGRFQARVVWLLPMLVILLAAAMYDARRDRKTQPMEV